MRITMSMLWVCTLCLSLPACDNLANSAPTQPQKMKTVPSDHPIIVELFQSQGCSSCPPANAALNSIADRSDVIALSYAVTYWDRLGWKDKFADPAFTQRQYDYKAALKADSVYTPQVVLNGTKAIVGNGDGELNRAVKSMAPVSAIPSISVGKGSVHIGADIKNASKRNATVWLVRYDPRTHNVAIRAGENGGRTLPHRNIVRQFTKLGNWSGKAADFALPSAKDAALKTVIIVQSGSAGAILSAKQIG